MDELLDSRVWALERAVEAMRTDIDSHVGDAYSGGSYRYPHPSSSRTDLPVGGFTQQSVGAQQSTGGNAVIGGGVLARVETAQTVANDDSETDIFSFTPPANTLGTNRALHYVAFGTMLNDSGGAESVTLRVKYDSVTLFEQATATMAANAAARAWVLDLWLVAQGSTTAIALGGSLRISEPSAAATGTGDLAIADTVGNPFEGATTNVDTTKPSQVEVSVELSVADADLSWTADYQLLELK